MLKQFFWMCSGADPELLAECPRSEQIRHAGIGGTVFFTALMAFIASAYALYTVFSSIPIALGFGFVWGLLIFNLDRFIVSSMRKQSDKMNEFLQAAPRIVLALIIAVVISKPLELKLFEKEINQVLLEQQNNMLLADQAQVATIYEKEKQRLHKEEEELRMALDRKKQEVDELYSIYIAEAEGREGTGKLGKGPVYQEKREKHDAVQADYLTLKANNEQLIQNIQTEREELIQKEKQKRAEGEQTIVQSDGLMARIHALSELPWLPSLFIFLLFLAIETSPIIAKLMSPAGIYDLRFSETEEKVAVWAEQKRSYRNALLQADTALNRKVRESLSQEDESYHYKKQQLRALLRFQSDTQLEEQKKMASRGL